MKKLLQIFIVTAFTAASDMTLTVKQLTEFIKSSIQMKHADGQVAE